MVKDHSDRGIPLPPLHGSNTPGGLSISTPQTFTSVSNVVVCDELSMVKNTFTSNTNVHRVLCS